MELKSNKTTLDGKMSHWNATTPRLHSLLQTAAACCTDLASLTPLLARLNFTPGTAYFRSSGHRDNLHRSLYSFQLKT